jgi:hypothetical protein
LTDPGTFLGDGVGVLHKEASKKKAKISMNKNAHTQ